MRANLAQTTALICDQANEVTAAVVDNGIKGGAGGQQRHGESQSAVVLQRTEFWIKRVSNRASLVWVVPANTAIRLADEVVLRAPDMPSNIRSGTRARRAASTTYRAAACKEGAGTNTRNPRYIRGCKEVAPAGAAARAFDSACSPPPSTAASARVCSESAGNRIDHTLENTTSSSVATISALANHGR
jgi:hypothetical protein